MKEKEIEDKRIGEDERTNKAMPSSGFSILWDHGDWSIGNWSFSPQVDQPLTD